MNSAQRTLLELLKAALLGIPAHFDETVDWNATMEEAGAQTVLPLASLGLPPEQRSAWAATVAQSKAHFMRALYEQTRVAALFNEKKIPFVVIKGTSAAMYYPTPACRTMGDVDLLVEKGAFESAFAILSGNGYQYQTDYGDGRDYSFTKGGVIFELHQKYSDEGHDVEDVLQAGIARAQNQTLYGNSFPALPTPENGLVLLDHIRHHLFGGVGLRQILDFMMFVQAADEESFERECLPLFEAAGLLTLARVIIKMCKRYFDMPAPAAWCDSADDATCDELMEKVLSSGNFGRKDPYEYHPMRELSMDMKKNGFFRALQRAGVANCQAFQKHKWLRPFAWLYQLFRYARRGVAALFRREKLWSDITEGNEKADFFKRLDV